MDPAERRFSREERRPHLLTINKPTIENTVCPYRTQRPATVYLSGVHSLSLVSRSERKCSKMATKIMDGEGNAPDLQSILATLAQHASSASNLASIDPHHVALPTPPVPGCETQETTSQDSRNAAHDPRVEASVKAPGQSAQTPSKPMIDPSTITTWQDALRCVTKIAAQNAQFAASINKVS